MELKTTDMYFITLVLSFHQMLKVSSFSMQTTHLGSLIRTFQGIPYSRCKFECKAKRKCLGFIYRRHIGLCMLLDDSDMGFGDRDPKISFRAKRDWKQDSFDEVCEETCSDLETCNDNESTVSCTLEECGEPPLPIGNVTQFGNFRQIGSEILYMCHGKSGLTGREVTSRVRSECQTGGEWLHQSVTCLEENAILYNYKGCFLDKPERALNEYQFYNTTMTISLCALICYEREQKYFGLEHYKHCFCGSTLMYEVPVTNCNTPCLGDQSTMCGGGWALNWPNLKDVADDNEKRHVGLCLLLKEFDTGVCNRDPRITFSAKQDWEQNSFDALCTNKCSEMETCHTDGNTVSCTFEECVDSPLMAGNISQLGNMKQIGSEMLYICHGYDALSTVRSECKTDGKWLFQSVTCMEEYSILYNYEGCFLDKEERVLNEFRFQDSTMTIPLCALTCYEREQKYFGLEHFKQCFCGSELFYEIPVTNCNTPCLGDQSTICGGTWALAVYRYIP